MGAELRKTNLLYKIIIDFLMKVFQKSFLVEEHCWQFWLFDSDLAENDEDAC